MVSTPESPGGADSKASRWATRSSAASTCSPASTASRPACGPSAGSSTPICALNGAGALLACHDKLLTAIRLARHGIPHPRTAHADDTAPPLHLHPVVVKPGSEAGQGRRACEDEPALSAHLLRLRRKRWFRRQGALVQELVPPRGRDLRLIVASGNVVGAVTRIAPPGEWRTNVALGATRQPVAHVPRDASSLALAAAQAVDADLVAVDLFPRPTTDSFLRSTAPPTSPSELSWTATMYSKRSLVCS